MIFFLFFKITTFSSFLTGELSRLVIFAVILKTEKRRRKEKEKGKKFSVEKIKL
jgi:hypothetical protein